MATRGTTVKVNKAINEPILLLGAERNLTILNIMLWSIIIAGVYQHFIVILPLVILAISQKLLSSLAKADPYMQQTFVTNQDFLLGIDRRFYTAASPAMYIEKNRALKTVVTGNI